MGIFVWVINKKQKLAYVYLRGKKFKVFVSIYTS